MSDTKISEAAIDAGARVLADARGHGMREKAVVLAERVIAAVLPHLHPQPAELAEQQGDAPEIEQLGKLVSSILSTVSLGHQTGPHAYAGEDFGRYLREATSNCRTILRMLPTLAALAATGKQQGVALRYLTQSELDSIGSQAEGMDGEQWDRWVQARFAEVNGFTTVDSDGFTAIATTGNQQVGEAERADDDWHLRGYAYASKQATTCASCGKHKHTPLRIDAMGGYVCLTCIDQKLSALLNEFGYQGEQVGEVQGDARAQFEAWSNSLPSLYRYNLNRWSNEAQEYRCRRTREAFTVWQAAHTSRQPGAQEAVRYEMWNPCGGWDECTKAEHEDWQRRGGGKTSRALYAAPPAQGIDLGQKLVELVLAWEDLAERGIVPSPGQMQKCARQVRAMIDQRDAAPGVGNG